MLKGATIRLRRIQARNARIASDFRRLPGVSFAG
jgi:hypothetical protein